MTTTTTTATTRSRIGWLRTLILTLGIALLGLTLRPPAVGAVMNQGDIHDNAMFQIALCEAGGGKAEVDVARYPDGIRSIQVKCKGGTFNGMQCDNSRYGVSCQGANPKPVPFEPGSAPSHDHLWQLGEVLPILESGSLLQIEQLVTDVDALYAVQAAPELTLTRNTDPQQDRDAQPATTKHGKQAGKHRR